MLRLNKISEREPMAKELFKPLTKRQENLLIVPQRLIVRLSTQNGCIPFNCSSNLKPSSIYPKL